MLRVSLINLNLTLQDAIGACVINQARFFVRRGDRVKIYVQHPPHDIPDDIRPLVQVAELQDLAPHGDEHFTTSDLSVYHYPSRYQLLDSLMTLERGAAIFYYHNVTPPAALDTDFEREILQYSLESVRPLASYADLVVTDSQFNADQLIHEDGCEADRVRVLPLGIPLDRFSPGPADLHLLQQYQLDGKRVILFVGRMAGNKRISLLVSALARVRQQCPNAVLLLVGDDRGNPALQEQVARAQELAAHLGCADAVIFTGPVADQAPYYRLASVYASASVHEGFGVPLIEAMASGVPVVASRATAHPWVLGNAGLLVDPDNADDLAAKIVQVLTDNTLSGELAQRGHSRSQEFSLERYESNWLKIVAEATAWLPGQPYPRLRPSADQPIETEAAPAAVRKQAAPKKAEQLDTDLQYLVATADVMLRGYTVRSKLPVVGSLIAWVRRNLTSHLREPYVDPMFERQVVFNRSTANVLRQLAEQVMEPQNAVHAAALQSLIERQQELDDRSRQIEAWLALVSTQLSLLQSQRAEADQLMTFQQQIDAMRIDLMKLLRQSG